MKEIFKDIRTKFQGNEYKNKEHLRISLVARILQKLGWNVWDPSEFYPEFIVVPDDEKSRVDVALFAVPSSPSVFINIQPLEILEQDIKNFERQLHDYNGNVNALFSILTDGKHWRFYYTDNDEKISNKCFKTIDIIKDDLNELTLIFEMYLSKDLITTGKAKRDVKNYLYQNIILQIVTEVLPKARLLLTEPPYPCLPEVIAQLAREKGFKITEDNVIKILKNIEIRKPSTDTMNDSSTNKKPPKLNTEKQKSEKKDIKSFNFGDKTFYSLSWKEMLVKVCEILYELHDSDFHRCLKLGDNQHLYFSENRNDLIDNAPAEIGNSGYFVMTNFKADNILDLIHRMLVIFGYNKDDLKITLS